MARIVVGMSGGVDSAAAAYLLRQQGHEVIGVTLRTWVSGGSRCCAIDDARQTARFLDIPYHVIYCAADFEKKIEEPFAESYLHGSTPNPCVFCNREIKWKWMLYAADILQADYVATGHYASVVRKKNGRCAVRRAEDLDKDQSYMLYRLSQQQLERTLFPLADLTKEDVRRLAGHAGLPSAGTRDSQEICFVAQGRYSDYIRSRTPRQGAVTGNFVDESGNVLGRHRGILYYTVGQRRGLGLALGYPAYVKEIRADSGDIVIAGEAALYRREITCGDLCFQSIPGLPEGKRLRAMGKIRYRHEAEPAEVRACGKDRLCIRFERPVRAPAPGQSAVLYDPDGCVVGGGIILPKP